MKKLIAAVAIAATLLIPSCAYMNHQTRICTVSGKDRISKAEGNSEMRVYTDCGTFTVEDNLIAGFNSADLFGRLHPGKKYELETGGFRVGIISEFPKILDAREV